MECHEEEALCFHLWLHWPRRELVLWSHLGRPFRSWARRLRFKWERAIGPVRHLTHAYTRNLTKLQLYLVVGPDAAAFRPRGHPAPLDLDGLVQAGWILGTSAAPCDGRERGGSWPGSWLCTRLLVARFRSKSFRSPCCSSVATACAGS